MMLRVDAVPDARQGRLLFSLGRECDWLKQRQGASSTLQGSSLLLVLLFAHGWSPEGWVLASRSFEVTSARGWRQQSRPGILLPSSNANNCRRAQRMAQDTRLGTVRPEHARSGAAEPGHVSVVMRMVPLERLWLALSHSQRFRNHDLPSRIVLLRLSAVSRSPLVVVPGAASCSQRQRNKCRVRGWPLPSLASSHQDCRLCAFFLPFHGRPKRLSTVNPLDRARLSPDG